MSYLLSFLYGWLAGILAVVVCLIYGIGTLVMMIRVLQRVLPLFGIECAEVTRGDAARRLHRTHTLSLRDEGLEGLVAGSHASSSPLKLAAMCHLTWYENKITGPPKECRVVLLGTALTVYEVLPSGRGSSAQGMQHHEGVALWSVTGTTMAEHLKGKVDISRITVTVLRQNAKQKRQSNIFSTGQALLLRSTDGRPLFVSHHAGDPFAGSICRPTGTSVLSGDVGDGDQHSVGNTGAPLNGSREPLVSGNSIVLGGDMDTWCSMVVQFGQPCVTDQWYTILRGFKEANAWRRFAETMPNRQTANIFLSRFGFQNLHGVGLENALKKAIQEKLRKVCALKLPRDIGGEVKLDDFIIGRAIPWISDVSEPVVSTTGEMGFSFNMQYKGDVDGFSLFFRLDLAYRGIPLPQVVFSVKLLELKASIRASIGPPPSKKFWIGGHKPPVVRLQVRPGCASGKGILHHILTALPDISGVFTDLIKLYLFSDLILPCMDDFPLPSVGKSPPSSPTHGADEVDKADKKVVFDRRRAARMSAAPHGRPFTESHAAISKAPDVAEPATTTGGAHVRRKSLGAEASASLTTESVAALFSGSSVHRGSEPFSRRRSQTHWPVQLNLSSPLGTAMDNLSPTQGSIRSDVLRSCSLRTTDCVEAGGSVVSMPITDGHPPVKGATTKPRKLKSLLRMKGSDMNREAVARTKVRR